MRLNAYLIVLLFVAIGCSHASKPATPPAPVPPATTSTTQSSPVQSELQRELTTCKRDEEVRTIEIELIQPKGCKLWYAKHGKRTEIAASVKGKSHCEQVHQRIQKNLETAEYKCVIGKISQNTTTP